MQALSHRAELLPLGIGPGDMGAKHSSFTSVGVDETGDGISHQAGRAGSYDQSERMGPDQVVLNFQAIFAECGRQVHDE